MKAKISKIILWPKRSVHAPRIVPFKMSGVEVITGKSQTGKSSLIPIVDYCLGSRKCAIPVGEIRQHVEWFGVVLKLPNAELLLARRNPGLQAQTSEMYLDMAVEVLVPHSLDGLPKTSTAAVLSQLNQFAGLPSLSLTGGDEGGFTGRPSFRDTAAFQFQPQHIVANPYTLFFKADTVEHQEKLKNIFPLMLGAIDGETLELRRQLRVLDAEWKRSREELEDRRRRSATWLQEFKTFYQQAREFGLLPDAPNPAAEWHIERYVEYLTPIPARLRENPYPKIEVGASRRRARGIAVLREAEESLAKDLDDRKRKLSRVTRLQSATDGYSKALTTQEHRLQPLSWFANQIAEVHSCPVCGSDTESAFKEISRLEALSKEVALTVGSIESVNHVLDKETGTLEEEIRRLEVEANTIRAQLAPLLQDADGARRQRQTIAALHNFSGRLEQELTKFAEGDRGATLVSAVSDLEKRVAELRSRIDQKTILFRQDEAIENISRTIGHYAEILGVEHYERSVRIDIRNLTLVVEGLGGRQDYLWEIGSAANWMGYHIAALLALHEHFLSVSNHSSSPSPQFIFIDQPSQAFFPERWSVKVEQRENDDPELDSDDIARVQRIFRALSEAVRRTKGRLQIILIEHVGEAAWKGMPEVHVIERWRGDSALIPTAWLTA